MKKVVKSEPVKAAKKVKIIKPMVIETIVAEKHSVSPVFGKVEYENIPVPIEHVRCIVLIDYKGMTDDLYAGDIIDLPARRYKTLSMRGFVKQYTGKAQPNKYR